MTGRLDRAAAVESEQRFRDVLDNVHLLAVSIDVDGRITFVNTYLCELTGWTREELVGSVWLDRFPTGDPDFTDRIRENRIWVHDEKPLITRSGERRDILWSNAIARDTAGAIVGATSIGEDITERNRQAGQEAALRRIAMMVAAESPPPEIFHVTTREVAQLFGGHTANLIRFDDPPSTGVVIAQWSLPDVVSMPLGDRVTFDGPTAVRAVIDANRPARIDDYADIPGELADRLRRLGLRSSVAAPITVGAHLWGAITVSTTGTSLLPADAELRIGEFTDLVALAISTAETRNQLAASRARIVAAGDAERRRLERNLHDGAQQRLVTLSLALGIIASSVPADSHVALQVDGAISELEEALNELRELARGIHPVLLTDHGLDPALRALAARSPVPVELVIDGGDRPGPLVEAAVYYVVAEALTNVAKYANATCARIRVSRDDAAISVDVTDDGVGGADPAKGTGLRGLADRVEALGGHLSLNSSPDGTHLHAHLPLHAELSQVGVLR
jgi:PAS domain S-box-containing protein